MRQPLSPLETIMWRIGRDAGLRTTIGTLLILDGPPDRRALRERLAGLPRARRPTAVFCANDLLALGLLQQMTAIGVDVPGELAIVGYDDIEFAGAAAVPLSSVRQPRQLLGRTAAELLLAESEADEAHVHEQVEFHPELVVRASSIGVTKRVKRPAPGRPSRTAARG